MNTTVTKLKAEVFNKELPVLLEDGTITNYYFGQFLNTIAKYGYTPTTAEKNALSAFIKNGIDNGWIDDVYYCLPFIGDSNNPNAGIVPLIDNLDDYKMTEYDGTEDFSDMFQFDQTTHKILSVHNNSTTKYFHTPLDYSKNKGFCLLIRGTFSTSSTKTNKFIETDVINDGGTNKYLRFQYRYLNERTLVQISNTTTNVQSSSVFEQQVSDAISASKDLSLFTSLILDDGLYKEKIGYDNGSNKSIIDSTSLEFTDISYGKFKVGQNLDSTYLKILLFVNPTITEDRIMQLFDDVATLTAALRR